MVSRKQVKEFRPTVFDDLLDYASRRTRGACGVLVPAVFAQSKTIILNSDIVNDEWASYFQAELQTVEGMRELAWELVMARCHGQLFPEVTTADEMLFYEREAGVRDPEVMDGPASQVVQKRLPLRLAYCLTRAANCPANAVLARALCSMYHGASSCVEAPFTTTLSVAGNYPCLDLRDFWEEDGPADQWSMFLAEERL